jgi:FixJ family two-component response regulator
VRIAALVAVAGLGAIHFFEKPFPRADFITLVEALILAGIRIFSRRPSETV